MTSNTWPKLADITPSGCPSASIITKMQVLPLPLFLSVCRSFESSDLQFYLTVTWIWWNCVWHGFMWLRGLRRLIFHILEFHSCIRWSVRVRTSIVSQRGLVLLCRETIDGVHWPVMRMASGFIYVRSGEVTCRNVNSNWGIASYVIGTDLFCRIRWKCIRTRGPQFSHVWEWCNRRWPASHGFKWR